MPTLESATTVNVDVDERGNCFVATSADVPGLHIWADSRELLGERVASAIRILYKANRNMDVVVIAHSEPDEFPAPPKSIRSFVVAQTTH